MCAFACHRLGTLLSGHVVNDPKLRKEEEQAHKDLIVACKVCTAQEVFFPYSLCLIAVNKEESRTFQ